MDCLCSNGGRYPGLPLPLFHYRYSRFESRFWIFNTLDFFCYYVELISLGAVAWSRIRDQNTELEECPSYLYKDCSTGMNSWFDCFLTTICLRLVPEKWQSLNFLKIRFFYRSTPSDSVEISTVVSNGHRDLPSPPQYKSSTLPFTSASQQ